MGQNPAYTSATQNHAYPLKGLHNMTQIKYVEKVKIRSRNFKWLWFIPFTCFFIGYVFTSYFLHKTSLQTPNVIGKSLHEGVQILSVNHLGLRLLQQREDATLPEGTIVDQIPCPSQKIRPNQNVFVTVSVRQRQAQMPDFWGKRFKEVADFVAKRGLEAKEGHLFTAYPAGMCIAQNPEPGAELSQKRVLLYFSDGKSPVCIMPDLRGALLSQLEETFNHYDVRAEIFHNQQLLPNHACTTCKVVEQQPVAGAIVDLGRGLHIQLRVASNP